MATSTAKHRFALQRVRLNQGGYDSTGTYWGIGMPLYCWQYYGDDEELDGIGDYIRAHDREDAKIRVTKHVQWHHNVTPSFFR